MSLFSLALEINKSTNILSIEQELDNLGKVFDDSDRCTIAYSVAIESISEHTVALEGMGERVITAIKAAITAIIKMIEKFIAWLFGDKDRVDETITKAEKAKEDIKEVVKESGDHLDKVIASLSEEDHKKIYDKLYSFAEQRPGLFNTINNTSARLRSEINGLRSFILDNFDKFAIEVSDTIGFIKRQEYNKLDGFKTIYDDVTINNKRFDTIGKAYDDVYDIEKAMDSNNAADIDKVVTDMMNGGKMFTKNSLLLVESNLDKRLDELRTLKSFEAKAEKLKDSMVELSRDLGRNDKLVLNADIYVAINMINKNIRTATYIISRTIKDAEEIVDYINLVKSTMAALKKHKTEE